MKYFILFLILNILIVFTQNITLYILVSVLLFTYFIIYKRKEVFIIIIIVIIPLLNYFIGINKNEKFDYNHELSTKGFISSEFYIDNYPELYLDNNNNVRYRLRSKNITFFYNTNYIIYKNSIYNINGYYSSYKINNKDYYNFFCKEISLKTKPNLLDKLMTDLKHYLEHKILSVKNEDIKSLLFSIILGNKNFLNYSVKESFKITGISHLLAISGLHVGIISFSVIYLLRIFFGEKNIIYFISSLVIIFYMVISGMSPSVMRAGIMFMTYNVLKILKVKTDFLNVLLFSSFVILLFNQFSLYNIGFWLSYLAVLGIYFFFDLFNERFKILGSFVSTSLSLSLSATITTLPLIIYFFKMISIISPIANLFIVPLFNVLVIILFLYFVFLVFNLNILMILIEFIIKYLWWIITFLSDLFSGFSFSYVKIRDKDINLFIAIFILIITFIFISPLIIYNIRIKYYLKRKCSNDKI